MAYLVTAYHGPVNTFNCLSYKPQYLTGLRDQLLKLGFRIKLVPVDVLNLCKLEMCGHEVFRCNIKNLCFNTTYARDKICMRAIDAVKYASVKLQRACIYLWICWLLEHELLKRYEFYPKGFWATDIKFESEYEHPEPIIQITPLKELEYGDVIVINDNVEN